VAALDVGPPAWHSGNEHLPPRRGGGGVPPTKGFMMRRILAAAVSLPIALAALVAVVAPLPAPGPAAAASEAPAGIDGILGFQIGEERRYVVGPEDALRDGEYANWSIRLDRVVTEGSRSIGVFEIGHEEARWGATPVGTIMVHWKYEGELRINERGFPEMVSFSMYEEHTGEAPWRGETMSASYTFEDGEYQKEIRVPDQEWRFSVPIASHDALDLDIPEGMFLFRPQARAIDFFTHPALLDLAVPEVLQPGWKQRTMFFKPAPPVRHPGEDWVRMERDKLASLGRYYDKITLEAGEETQLEIAGRTITARRLETSGSLRGAYLDEGGRIVYMEIDPDPWTRRPRHIRMLYPSEY